MRKVLFASVLTSALLAALPFVFATDLPAQDVFFQPGNLDSILAVRFSPDNNRLISFSPSYRSEDDRLCLWDVRSGRLLWMRKTGFVQRRHELCNLDTFLWSAEGRFIVTQSLNGSWQTWDAATGAIVALSDVKPGIEFVDAPGRVGRSAAGGYYAISEDGSLQAEPGPYPEADIRITDIRRGRAWWIGPHPDMVNSVAFNRDGTLLAAAGEDRRIYLFDAAKRTLLKTLACGAKPVTGMSFTPDGNGLLVCDKAGDLKIWDLGEARALASIFAGGPHDFEGLRSVLSPDGMTVMTTREDEIVLWDAASLRPLRKLKINGKYSVTHGIYVSSSDTLPVCSAVYSAGGKRILAAYGDGTLRAWDPATGKHRRLWRLRGDLRSFALFPDEKGILAGIHDEKKLRLSVLDIKTGRALSAFDDAGTGDIEEFAVSPDGRFVAAAFAEPYVLIWAVGDPKPRHILAVGSAGFCAIAFSPDGKTLAAGGKNQNVILFDVETGARLWQLIPDYQPAEIEAKLSGEWRERHALLDAAKARWDEQAARDTAVYEKQVRFEFEHYGVMKALGSLRFSETGNLDKSRIATSPAGADAVWLRLRNDSSLPIKLTAATPYLPALKCVHQFPDGSVIPGLCPDKEIALRMNGEDRKGRAAPPSWDNGFIVYLLPKTSVLVPVPLAFLEKGHRIRVEYTFHNAMEKGNVWAQTAPYMEYGPKKMLRFGLADIPKSRRNR